MTDARSYLGRHARTAVRPPIGAAEAALRAARARSGTAGADGRSSRALALTAVGIGAVLALLAACILWRAVTGALLAPTARESAPSVRPEPVDQAVTLDADDPGARAIVYGSRTYTVRRMEDGSLRAVRSGTGDQGGTVPLFSVEGEPAGLAVYNYAVIVVENHGDRFAVRSCVDTDGSVPVTIAEASGSVTGVELDKASLRLEVDDDKTFEIDLDIR